MTDPVILLGTQSNGETLPVQVDGFGRLVAEGLAGSEGPPGPEGLQGPPGPEGPPGNDGLIQWPPNPQEGYVLTWIGGTPQWRKPIAPLQNIWSDYLTSESGGWATPETGPTKAFDGDSNTSAVVAGSGAVIFGPPAIAIVTLRFSTTDNGALPGYKYRAKIGDIQQEFLDGGDTETWFNISRAYGSAISEQTPLTLEVIRPNGSRANGSLARLEVNGQLLVDSTSQYRQFYRSNS